MACPPRRTRTGGTAGHAHGPHTRLPVARRDPASERPRSLTAEPAPYAGRVRLPTTPVTTLQRELRDEVRQNYRAGRIILGVDGIDGAGKTVFADGLADVFAEDGAAVFRASMDGFRSEEQTSEIQSLMRITYAVF